MSVHPYQVKVAKDGGFGHIDRSLERHVSGISVIAEKTTRHALAKIRNHFTTPKPQPLFLWVHYYDPHAPYVSEDGSPWSFSSDITLYAREVRRTSAAVEQLATGIAKLRGVNSLLFVTADHGEEFGEKGHSYHSNSLNEHAIRIPMVAWSPNPALNKHLPHRLPATIAEIGPYLAAAVSGTEYVGRDEAFFAIPPPSGTVFGLYRKGWKILHYPHSDLTQLYHVATDPEERHNVAARHPGLLQELQARLAGYLKSPRTQSVMEGVQGPRVGDVRLGGQ